MSIRMNSKVSGLKAAGVQGWRYTAMLTTLLLLAGCAMGERGDTQTGMREAASEYCESRGGQTEVQKTRLGSGRYCRLPGGRLENEWQLYRSERLDND